MVESGQRRLFRRLSRRAGASGLSASNDHNLTVVHCGSGPRGEAKMPLKEVLAGSII